MTSLHQKTVNILGSTGSIGTNALVVIGLHPESYKVRVLTAHSNGPLLVEQAKTFRPERVVIGQEHQYQEIKEVLAPLKIEVCAGEEALCEAAALPADVSVVAISGLAALRPTWHALTGSRQLALANKESIVSAGRLLMKQAESQGAQIVPVDSEHSGLFQLLQGRSRSEISRCVLTASGGPFRGKTREELAHVSVLDALKHPTWHMGLKNTIDSATLVNKGLELIEASALFDLTAEQLDAWVHPQSIVHGMLELCDGALLMQASRPDMRSAIGYGLSFPDRHYDIVQPLDKTMLSTLSFEDVDHVVFPAIQVAKSCLKQGAWACIAFNASNEMAVTAFVDGRIPFLDVLSVVQETLTQVVSHTLTTVEEVFAYEALVREKVDRVLQNFIEYS